MALRVYQRKRDFAITPEPRGSAAKKPSRSAKEGGQFVIQKHAARRLHYDFRLELDGTMKSWAVTRGPSLVPGEKRLAVHTEDHPIEYNKFEGIIPKGQYGGGTVMIWDRGRWIPEGDPRRGYAKGHLSFRLEGEKLSGNWHLVRMRPRKGEKQEPWLFIKASDETARDPKAPDILEEMPNSVVSGRSIEEITLNKPAKKRKSKPKITTWNSNRKSAAEPMKSAGMNTAAKNTAAKPKRKATTKRRAEASRSGRKRSAPTLDPAKISGSRPARLPDFLPPCLASLHAKAPSGSQWLHEIKFDGYRIQSRLELGKVKLLTRKGLDWTRKFQPVADAVADLAADRALLDGEIVVEGEHGVSSFSTLQAHLSEGRTDRFVYYAFDLLHLDGRDLTASPLVERKDALQALLADAPTGGILRLSETFDEDGPTLLKHACQLNLEGIVSKRRDAPYRSGRSENWFKTKCSDRQEFIVLGYSPSTVLKRSVGALVLGYYEGDRLRYAGRVGTGFSQASSKQLWQKLEPLRIDAPLLDAIPAEERRRPVHWVKAQMVVEIAFRGWTADRILRHGSFKGLREDKSANEVVREFPQEAKTPVKATRKKRAAKAMGARSPKAASSLPVRLTHPDRIYWEDIGLTKQGLAEFYRDIWEWIGPHLIGRPLSIVRCPEGVSGECFFQKHATAGIDAAHFQRVPDRGRKDFFAVRDVEGLLALVQAGALELHVWGSQVEDIDRCDRIVFDLDPGPDVPWSRVNEAAREVRDRLAALKLESFVKTSGGKGLHVVLPIQGADWDTAKSFAHRVALEMTGDSPQRFTANMAKQVRTGRIFVDYLRNGRGATSIVAYSTRARAGAPVSTPVRWDELGPKLLGDSFTVANLRKRLSRLRKDPWADIGRVRQNLPKVTRRSK